MGIRFLVRGKLCSKLLVVAFDGWWVLGTVCGQGRTINKHCQDKNLTGDFVRISYL
jgi:hypothetical protein